MNKDDFSGYLVNIQKQFFSCVPVIEICLKDICFDITEENENKLIDGTVNHPIILKYPVKYSYQTSFLKKLLSILESGSTTSEIADAIYEHYVRVLNSKSDVYYKHYYLDDNNIITLEENPNLISDGTTGLCTWQASLLLAEWCFQNNHLFDSKNIFELGSGVGLLGIVLSKKTTAKEIWLSDCHSQVLNKLCKNIKLNTTDYKIIDEIHSEQFDQLRSGRTLLKAVSGGSVEGQKTFGVKHFDWVDVSTPGLFSDLFCDYVLAADVVYDSSVFEHLCKSFLLFTNLNINCVIFVSCTVRNAETLNAFLKTIEQTDTLHYQKLDCVKPKVLFWNQDTPIELYALYSSRSVSIFTREGSNDIYGREAEFLKIATQYNVDWAPKLYGYVGERLLILEDLSELGFATSKERGKFNLNQCYAALKSLAKFHAFYFQLIRDKKQLNPNYSILKEYSIFFQEVVFQFDTELGRDWSKATLDSFNCILDEMPISNSKIKTKINEKYNDFIEYLKPMDNQYKVISHGDLWSNNIMFSNENDSSQKCCFVDYQVLRFLLPTHDILALLHLNTTTKFRRTHDLNQFFDYYYQQFSDELNKNGLDSNVVYPIDVFKSSINTSIIPALFLNLMCKSFILMDFTRMSTYIAESNENCLWTKKRAQIIKHELDTDNMYKQAIFEEFQILIDEIVKLL